MTLATSSAEPLMLVRYSEALVLVDDALGAEANRLRSALQHFEATCREPGFRMQVSHVADALARHALSARSIDLRVRDIGVGFQLADGGGMYGPLAGTFSMLLSVLPGYQTGVLPHGVLDTARDWLVAHVDEFPDPVERGKALLAYLGNVGDTPEERQALADLFEGTDDLKTGLERIKAMGVIVATPFVLDPIRGSRWNGQVILHGSNNFLREIGWSGNLRNVQFPVNGSLWQYLKDANVHKYARQSGIDAAKGAFSWVDIGLAIGAAIPKNYEEYHDDGAVKIGCGVAVDAALELGCVAAGTGVGTYAGGLAGGALLGAVSGGLLAPVGVAIGGKIGGIAGGWLGKQAAEELDKAGVDEWMTDKLDEGADALGDVVGDLAENAADHIDAALSSAVEGVVAWF